MFMTQITLLGMHEASSVGIQTILLVMYEILGIDIQSVP